MIEEGAASERCLERANSQGRRAQSTGAGALAEVQTCPAQVGRRDRISLCSVRPQNPPLEPVLPRLAPLSGAGGPARPQGVDQIQTSKIACPPQPQFHSATPHIRAAICCCSTWAQKSNCPTIHTHKQSYQNASPPAARLAASSQHQLAPQNSTQQAPLDHQGTSNNDQHIP